MKKCIAIETSSKLIGGINQLHIEVGTNCPKGGDSGRGGRTYIGIAEAGGTVWDVTVQDEHGELHTFDSPSKIAITMGGDSELDSIIRALEFTLAVLKGTCVDATKKSRDVVL